MGKLDVSNRLAFLAKQFDVFEHENMEDVELKCSEIISDGWETSEPLLFTGTGADETLLGLISTKKKDNGYSVTKVSISYKIFTDMVGADPTKNKVCLQWMLNTLSKFIKEGNSEEAVRFALEDLPQANEYLTLFEANKRKKKFREMAEYSLKGFKDITNINEYKNLSQLYDAVDPFIMRDPSEIESIMNRFVTMGEAEIPFKDRRYTIFIPKSRDANVIFDRFAGWCTAKNGNGMFQRYTKNNTQPNGGDSVIYIVIDNGFFTGDNENIYQIHFETRQIMNRSNSSNFEFYDEVLINSEGVRNYFGDVLFTLAKDLKKSLDDNFYLDALIKFGFTEALFDMMDAETPIIQIDKETNKRKIPKIPDISRFSDLKILVVMEASLNELHPSIGKLSNLKMMSFFGNNIKELPSEIGNLSNLIYLNLVGNPITVIPENIKRLDKTNGGMLHRVAIDKNDISDANYQKLMKLLPSVEFH